MADNNNLPDGCRDEDLPGNTKQDIRREWEDRKIRDQFYDLLTDLEKIISESDLKEAEDDEHGKSIICKLLIEEIENFN